MSDADTNYIGAILEEVRDQYKTVLEAVGDMQHKMGFLAKQDDLDQVVADMKVVKAVVKDISKQQKDHEHRITRLEIVNKLV